MCSEHRLPVLRNQLYNLFFASHRFVGGLYFFFGGTLMNGSVVFFLPFYHFFIHLVWSGWGCTRARDTSNWCTHAVRLLCVHCVFNLYADGDNKRLATNVHVRKGQVRSPYVIRACEIMLLSHGFLEWSCNCCVRVQITQGNRGTCRACPKATVLKGSFFLFF